jgi:hypothetical protein
MPGRISGMEGFSEAGEWEFGAGTVKGYREWQLKYSRKFPQEPLVPDNYLMGHWGGQWTGSDWQEARCDLAERMAHLEQDAHSNTLQTMLPEFHSPSDIPAEMCGCGFWAFWEPTRNVHKNGPVDFSYPAFTLDGYWAEFSLRDKPAWVKAHIQGVGEGAGRTIIGEKGFRSQKMKMIALAVVTPNRHPIFDASMEKFFDKTAEEMADEIKQLVEQIVPGVPIVNEVEKLKEFM